MTVLECRPLGYVSSCYRERFGIPRQPGLVTEARAILTLLPAYSGAELVRGLDGFSHVWLIFRFHATETQGWHPTVRPPRLGGQVRVGVFASRSMFRPNPLGLSVVRLDKVESGGGMTRLHLSGADLLDGTPVLDIKPYLPYADSLSQAEAGFAPEAPSRITVVFSVRAEDQCAREHDQGINLRLLVEQVLGQDPRPSWRRSDTDERVYGMRLCRHDVRFRYRNDRIEVLELVPVG
ncbi:MAG: tRNA (N6-threonylcarbamoyladenosine(37)-N6)-methyltransferase TrmO [Thiothrix sp.]|nr:tRNA (N6-threonylcarbamoyladenosine(37)-N6)-methyltransferase TrmO [Thiothrix sp.]